jgi:enamine deaminase RidA (YjgF/YER057c/UK114 family)
VTYMAESNEARTSEVLRAGQQDGVHQHSLTIQSNGLSPAEVFGQIGDERAAVLMQLAFGGIASQSRNAVPLMSVPTTWVCGDGCSGEHFAGMQAICARGVEVRNIHLDGQLVGRAYADEFGEYCYLGGVLPANPAGERRQQARSVFERMEAALKQVGMDFTCVVRTWLYLNRLLEWYGPFNEVRSEFFKERGVFGRIIPASTGIGAGNAAGAAVLAGAMAIKPRSPDLRVYPVGSPMQCQAINYRSAFSRAMEVARPGLRQLYISGTASIDPDGVSVHANDPAAQIDLTMRVVHAILRSRNMDWADCTRMVAYHTDMRSVELFGDWCRRQGLIDPPVIHAHAKVCREDLLFELEADAATELAAPGQESSS